MGKVRSSARRLSTLGPFWRGLGVILFFHTGHANAQDLFGDARLVDVSVGPLSEIADDMARGSGLLSDGTRYSFQRYYSSNWVDLRFKWLTPLSENFGLYWGFGTGESGEKYRIDPSLNLGFVATQLVSDDSYVSLSLETVLGGYLTEESCVADYGSIGGVQNVNCRMADSLLPPSETLDFLLNDPPEDRLSITLRFRINF